MPLVVITGGARSGKSSAAQALAVLRERDGVPVTVAVFGRADDEEMRDRISRHRADRPAGFTTLEVGVGDIASTPLEWLESAGDDRLLVIDCLGTLLGLVMEATWPSAEPIGLGAAGEAALPPGYAQAVSAAFSTLVAGLTARRGDTIVVTNEVGAGIVPQWATARLFRDVLGAGNRVLVDAADAAYLAVAGRLVSLSDLPVCASWPVD